MNLKAWFLATVSSLTLWGAPDYGQVKSGVFVPRCAKCHTAPGASADLDLFSYDTLMASGVVMAGKADDSTLMQRVVAGEMPEDGPPLTADELKLIREWIDGGALDVPASSTLSIKSVRPGFGSMVGGSFLEIDGEVLTGVKSVLVGGVACSDLRVISDQRVTCVAPASASTGKVSIRLENGSHSAELKDAFEYRLPLSGSYQSLAMNIFGPRCVKCHSGASPRKGLDLSTYAGLMKHRRAVVPYDTKRSRIYKKVIDGEMPKDSDPLSRDETNAIADWIRAGAADD